MWSRWTEKARTAIWAANDMAAAQGQDQVEPEQLLFAVLQDETSVACRLLKRLEIDLHVLRARVLQALPDSQSAAIGEQPSWYPMKPVLDAAYAAAWDLNTNYVGTEHLLLALLKQATAVRGLLQAEGLVEEPVRQAWFDFAGARPNT